MKALITGAGGQLGRVLIQECPPGWACRGLTRQDLDLTDGAAIMRTVDQFAPDVVINAAAYTAVDSAESDAGLAFSVNADAVAVLAGAAASCGAHLVQISTDFVFDGASGRAYLPNAERRPLSVYGRSKAAGEDAAGALASVLRTSWVYGARGANFVNTMLRLMRSSPQIRVVADQISAPTWTTGLASLAWKLAEGRHPGIFHHCDAGVASWYDFACAIQEEALILGILEQAVPVIPITSAEYTVPAPRPAFSLLDATSTHSLLGAEVPHWRVNLRKMLAEQALV